MQTKKYYINAYKNIYTKLENVLMQEDTHHTYWEFNGWKVSSQVTEPNRKTQPEAPLHCSQQPK